jgi:SEC-C motif-containing protein
MSQCPCGSGKSFSACCEPYLTGAADAPTAEALMRSRYTAYTLNKTAYIESSHDPETRDSLDLEATGRWAGESEWLGLKILRTEAGGKKDDRGIVEFEARYRQNGEEVLHHEESIFIRRGGTWFFYDGHKPSLTVVREEPKVGRNDPCPCGSGKKYKKCCGS